MVRVGSDLQIWNPAFLKEGKCSLTQVLIPDPIDCARSQSKQRSRESVLGEATMLRAHMYDKCIIDQLAFSRYGLNLEDFDHVLNISVDTRYDE